METSHTVVITKKSPIQDYDKRFHILFGILFFSTVSLLIPVFYQLMLSKPFWEQNFILALFFIGMYGYLFLFAYIIGIIVGEIGGKVSNSYRNHKYYYNLGFIIIVTISAILIFYAFFGMGAVGPIIGSVAALAIKWYWENKIKKPT